MAEFLNKVVQWSCCGISLAVLAGCVGTIHVPDEGTMRLNSEQFRVYVERTFRHQNRVADRLAFKILDADDNGDRDYVRRLEVLDERLSMACAGINELAVAQRDGVRLSARRKLELARQVPACSDATNEVAAALP